MEEIEDFAESENQESSFDLKAEIYKYLAFWRWLVFGSLLGLFIAFLYNRYTIPEYRTVATMMILQDEKKKIAGALPSGGASILALDDSNMQNQIETLRSKRLVQNVIDELDLNISYFSEGKIIAVEAYEESAVVIEFLSPDSIVHQATGNLLVTPLSSTSYKLVQEEADYSQTHEFGEIVSLGGIEFTILPRGGEIENRITTNIIIRPLRQTADDYISRMVIAQKGRANDILSLSITGEVPEKSQDFLNVLMRHFNLDGMADKSQVAENTSEFIQERLQRITDELDTVEGGIAQFKRENELMDIASGAEKYIAQSTAAEQEIFAIETQLRLIRSVREALNSAVPYRLLPTGGFEEAGISAEISNFNTLVLKRNEMLQNSTPRHPLVQEITEQLNILRDNILESIESTIDVLNVRIDVLEQRDVHAEEEFSAFPGLEQGMRNKERQQEIKEELYLFLLQRREESAISFAATSPVAKVIDPAFTDETPIDPKPGLILGGGFLVGFMVPLFIIFGKNFLDTKIHHKGDLHPLIKEIPFLGEIPKVSSDGEDEFIQVNDRSPLAESFRILRTNLAYLVQSRNKEKGQVLFVTSTIKGEGKTFISYNLARTLASTNKKVLLVGGDIRNPRLHKFTGTPVGAVGLSDFLYNYDLKTSDIITPSNEGNIPVDLVFSGAVPPNPAELFMNDRMETLIKTEEKNYDYIIVDTAPTMIVTDTLLISPLADTTLYITRAGFTEKKLMDFPKDLKNQGKLKGVAVVLNDVDYSKFSYGAKYGYAYGYGYGYGADEEKKSIFNWFRKKKV